MVKIFGLAAAGLLLLALLSLVGLYVWKNYGPDRGDLKADIDRMVARWQGADAPVDLVIAVVKNGEARYLAYGPEGATPDSLFQIGSVTKVFTGLLLQVLVDEGKLRMEDRLSTLIGDRYPLAPAVADVTLRQLATHTAGLPSVPAPIEDEVKRRLGKGDLMADPYNILSREEVLSYLANPIGKTAPGRFSYSNYGMGLLAHVLELKTGETYPALLQRLLFQPLGMKDSHGDLETDVAARLVQGHDAAGKPVGPWHFTALGGAGAITSSARDLVRFIEAEFDPSSPLALSLARQREKRSDGSGPIAWQEPGVPEWLEGSRTIFWHNGAVNGYFSYIAIDPGRRHGVVVLANRQKDVTALGLSALRLARTQSW